MYTLETELTKEEHLDACYLMMSLEDGLIEINDLLGPAGGMVVKALDTRTWPTMVRVLDLVACFLTFPLSVSF